MKRFLYRALVALHPRHFRERFGEEMLWIFDQSAPDRTLRFFPDCLLSLLRQWFLRSDLWKMAAGTAISALLLCAWGNSMTNAVNRWLNASLGEPTTRLNKAEFSREAAQAVEILARIRKMETRKQHIQPHDSMHSAPNPSSSGQASKG